MDYKLGTHQVAGWNERRNFIALAMNSPEHLAAGGQYSGCGRCWAAFDQYGRVIAISYLHDHENAFEIASKTPDAVAVCPFMASCTQLVFEKCPTILTACGDTRKDKDAPWPTLGFTGTIFSGNRTAVRYRSGVKQAQQTMATAH